MNEDIYQVTITRKGLRVMQSVDMTYAELQASKHLMINTDSSFEFTVLNITQDKEYHW